MRSVRIVGAVAEIMHFENYLIKNCGGGCCRSVRVDAHLGKFKIVNGNLKGFE